MTQREVLEALVRLYEEKRRLIKSREIAALINRDEGTVRNVMLSLKSWGLLKSKTGPAGGYMPTLKAYEVLRAGALSLPLRLMLKGEEAGLVLGLELIDVLNPEGPKALLRFTLKREIDVHLLRGEEVEVWPSEPLSLFIRGRVVDVDPASMQMSVHVSRLASIPKISIGEVMTPREKLYVVTPEARLRDVAAEFARRRIRGAPVVEGKLRVVGVITQTDLMRAYIEGGLDSRVADYMSTPPITARESDDVAYAIAVMHRRKIGRLPVVDDFERLVGIVTKTDILRSISVATAILSAQRGRGTNKRSG
jgi:hypothetical protein